MLKIHPFIKTQDHSIDNSFTTFHQKMLIVYFPQGTLQFCNMSYVCAVFIQYLLIDLLAFFQEHPRRCVTVTRVGHKISAALSAKGKTHIMFVRYLR